MDYSIIQKSQLEGAHRLDAEYYQPKYFALFKTLQKASKNSIAIGKIAKVFNGKTASKQTYIDNGVRILKVDSLTNSGINWDNGYYVEKSFYEKARKARVCPLDILMTNAAHAIYHISKKVDMIEKDAPDKEMIAVGELMVVRPNKSKINPYYLLSVLKSRYLYQLFQRNVRGNTAHLYPKDVALIKIPVFGEKIQQQIEAIIKKSLFFKNQSSQLYLQAENLLLDKVGFNKLNLKNNLCYTGTLKRVKESHRFDAEHFQPKYDRLVKHLAKTGEAYTLSSISNSIHRGKQAVYDSNGKVLAFTEKHLSKQLLNTDGAEKTNQKFYNNNLLAQIKKEDILMYSIGAYIGRANVYLGNQKAVASSNITIIKVNKDKCNPIYLSVFLNSELGRLQAEQWKASVGQQALYPSDIAKFIIYLPSQSFQQKIASLVRRSHKARKKSKELLEQAKRQVEEVIKES